MSLISRVPIHLNNLINIIINTGSIVHGGFVRDLVCGAVDNSWNRDIDIVASENLLIYLKNQNIDLIFKQDMMLYSTTDSAVAEFMGYKLDMIIITDNYYIIKNGHWQELFRTEDFECNALYIDNLQTIKSRNFTNIDTIVGQIKAKQAFPSRKVHIYTSLDTIYRYLHRCYKMLKKGYMIMDVKVKLIEESNLNNWTIMLYNENIYLNNEI